MNNNRVMDSNIKCPVCGEGIKNAYLKNHFFNGKNYKLYHCLECDIQFWHPLEIMPGFYEDKTNFANFGLYQEAKEDILPENQRPFFTRFPIKKGNLLDVGCGNGRFLAMAEGVGFSVFGTDFNKGRINTAKEKFGIKNVYAMGLEEFADYSQKEGIKFDVVTFFDVLEHQDNPKKFIELVRKILKPGGWIVGTVPNRERPWADRERNNLQTGDVPPHHLLWLSGKSLNNIFARHGFEIRNYPVPINAFFLSAYLESLIFGDLGRTFKAFIKKIFFKNSAEKSFTETTENKNEKNKFIFRIFYFLKNLKNCVFLPLALVILKFYNKKGATIYFQGILKDDNQALSGRQYLTRGDNL